ncbi:MAG: glycosyltransferase family 4 protein [Patescibacteria group bacterium]
MKIAFLSFYSGEVYRGVETFVHELSNRLAKLGHHVTVYQNGKPLNGSMYEVFSTLVVWNYPKTPIRSFTKKVLSEISKDTDVIIPTNGGWQVLLSRWWAFKNNKKMVIPGQAGPGSDERFNLYMFPDVFIGLTDFQCKWAKNINPFVKVKKIPNGVDLSRFTKVGKAPKINLSRPIVLCVAALVPVKRLGLAIYAVSRMKKGSLLLVGRGEQEQILKSLGKELLPNRFQILSFPHTQMPQVYKAADIFTFPTSKWESFGIAIVEAMASGLPVVVTDDPIRREVVGNAGLFVDPKNAVEYARSLEKTLKKGWGNAPREQAEKFSWDEIAKEYDKLFNTLVVSGVEP